MSDGSVVLVPVAEIGIDDEVLAARWLAACDDGYIVMDILVEAVPALALVEMATGKLACHVPMPEDAGDAQTLTALLDMWDVMQSRPATLN